MLSIGQRGYIPPFTYQDVLVSSGTVQSQPNLTLGVTTAQGGSIMLGPDAVTGFTVQTWWNQLAGDGQTLAATITIEASNDPRASTLSDEQSNAKWFNLTSQITKVDPTSGSGDYLIQVSDVRFEYLRMSLSSITGSGRFKAIFAGHGS